MSWPSFLAPGAAWLLLAAIPLVLLYFLKLKRPRQRLSSLVLWRQVLRDERVNSPFKKLEKSLLLLLQLLLLLMLVLAAMQPVSQVAAGQVDRVLVLLDRSASMAALDRPGGESRLAAAKAQVLRLIDGLEAEQEMSVIAFAGTAALRCPFGSDKRVLRAAIAGVEVEDRADDLGAALRMAGAMARSIDIGRVLLVSDGNLPADTSFDLPFALEYVRLPRGGPNLGITRLHASRSVDGGWQVFALVEGSDDASAGARLALLHDGEVRFDEAVVAHGADGHRLQFPIEAGAAGERTAIELRLRVDGFDSLAADDRGYLALQPGRPVRARVDDGLESFRRALDAHQGVELSAEAPSSGAAGDADLVIRNSAPGAGGVDGVDGVDVDAGDAGDVVTLSVGSIPAELDGLLAVEEGAGSVVVDWQRGDPLLDHVELADLAVIDRVRFVGEADEQELERRGWEVVAHGREGPLILRRAKLGARARTWVLLFDPERSTLPYRVGLPILVQNLIGIAMRAAGLREVAGMQAGVLPPVQLPLSGECAVVGPDGSRAAHRADGDGRVLGVRAPRVGWYRFEQDGQERLAVGVNLLDPRESTLVVREELQVGELSVAAGERELEASWPWWSWLVGLGLPLLLLEWWLYRRRPAGAKAAATASAALPAAGAGVAIGGGRSR